MPIRLPFVPRRKLDAALAEIEKRAAEYWLLERTLEADRAELQFTAAQRDRLADEVEKWRSAACCGDALWRDLAAGRSSAVADRDAIINAAVKILTGDGVGMVAVSQILSGKVKS